MLPTATVEHALDGRLRVRIPERRGDTGYFRNAVEKLSAHPAVTRLEANPTTASILIHHRSNQDALGALAKESGLFFLQQKVPDAARNVVLAERTAEALGLPMPQTGRAAGLGLIGLSAYAAAQGNVIGPATENFWHAFGAWRMFKNPTLAAALIALGLVQVTRGRLTGSAVSLALYALVTLELSGLDPLSGRTGPRSGARSERPRKARPHVATPLP